MAQALSCAPLSNRKPIMLLTYRTSDVFVISSSGEGFGIVFLEAAVSGTRLEGGIHDGELYTHRNSDIGLAIDPKHPD